MPPLTHMNSQPLRYGAVTDFGQPGRREVFGIHSSIGKTRREIHRLTRPGFRGVNSADQHWWVAEVDPKAARYIDIRILTYLPEGPYSESNRPDLISRRAP